MYMTLQADSVSPHSHARRAPIFPHLRRFEAMRAGVDGALPTCRRGRRVALIGRIALVLAATGLACAFALIDVSGANAQSSRHGGARAATGGTVIQGGDTVSLIATLPWWRIDASRAPNDESGELESPILTACDVWLGFPFATADAKSLTVRLAEAQHVSDIDQVANHVQVADAGELNELDLAAPEAPHDTGSPWLRVVFALVGVVAAGFSASLYFLGVGSAAAAMRSIEQAALPIRRALVPAFRALTAR